MKHIRFISLVLALSLVLGLLIACGSETAVPEKDYTPTAAPTTEGTTLPTRPEDATDPAGDANPEDATDDNDVTDPTTEAADPDDEDIDVDISDLPED